MQTTSARITVDQLLGLDESHLYTLPDGHRLQAEAASAFAVLCEEARTAGFAPAIASSYRSFERQLAIFNAKATGARAVHDDVGATVVMESLAPAQQLDAILRFSALPGTSRHHWGTDLDIYDQKAVPEDYVVQLTPQEVATGGVFDPFHCWLDERIALGQSQGFYRPYAVDRGGVSPERWHLSYAPLSQSCDKRIDAGMLREVWQTLSVGSELALLDLVSAELDNLLERYVKIPADWCPRV
ncbi:MAG: M15 family metallopeptidase [Halioglobus sp.]